MDNNQNNQNNQNKEPGRRPTWFVIVLIAMVCFFLFQSFYGVGQMFGSSAKKVAYSEFVQMVEDNLVESASIGSSKIEFVLKADETEEQNTLFPWFAQAQSEHYTERIEDDSLVTILRTHNVKFEKMKENTTGAYILSILVSIVLPILLIGLLMSFLMKKMSKGGGIMGIGKNNAKMYVEKKTGVTFKDVAGQDEIDQQIGKRLSSGGGDGACFGQDKPGGDKDEQLHLQRGHRKERRIHGGFLPTEV